MATHDTVADMLTRIRNAQRSKFLFVNVVNTSFNTNILAVLKLEGYIEDYSFANSDCSGFQVLNVKLKYKKNGDPNIDTIQKVSKSSKRVYSSSDKIPYFKNGFGVYIVSTSKGVVSDNIARSMNVGGELICRVC